MVEIEHCAQKLVLTIKVVVERTLGDTRSLGNIIDCNAGESSSVEEFIRRVENPASRVLC